MVRYFGPDNGSAYVQLPNGRLAAGRTATVYADGDATVLADILSGTRDEQGEPITNSVVLIDSTGRLNFWFPDDNPVAYVSANEGPLVRVTADLQDQLDDAIISGGGGGGTGDVTTAELTAAIAAHSADTTAVHGITDTSALETKVGAQSKADTAQGTAVSIAASDATSKAASAQSTAISTASSDATAKVAAHAAASDPHGDRAFAQAGLDSKADLVGGVIPTSQIPAIAITEFLGTVANQTTMLALIGQKGDWTIRTDTGTMWIITGNTPSNISSWTQAPSAGAPVSSVNGYTGSVTLGKADIGLGSVDNTADVDKPVSTATQTALNLKAPLASPTFTGTVGGITKSMVGLGNVDNTADASKPVSTAQQAALDGKQPLDADLTAIAALDSATSGMLATDGTGWFRKTYSAVKTALGLTKADVGLGNVDNTADTAKPVSTAQQTALDGKQPLDSDLTTIAGLTATTNNVIQSVGSAWASRTPAQLKATLALAASDVGLGSVNNTSDASKPVSTAQQTALDAKADLVGGLVPTSQLPAIAITEVFTAANQAAMLALTAQRGDVAVRTDNGKTFILSTDSPSTLADWKEITAIGTVTSVNGQQGVVVLAKTDVGLGNVTNALQLVAANNLSDVANAGTARTNLGVPPSTRAVTAGTGLTGGGDLSADRSFAVAYGVASGTAAQGNDARITGAVQGPASATDNAIVRYDGTTGKLAQASLVAITDAGAFSLSGITAPAYAAGLLFYDGDNQNLAFYNNEADVKMDVGMELWVQVRNQTGSDIPNGKAVYISGTHASGIPTIALAQANVEATSIATGVTTHTIENNSIGYVTTDGLVHGVDTSAFAGGDVLYLSAASAGGLVNVKPSAPNIEYRIGVVAKAAAGTGGMLYIDPGVRRLGNGTANQMFGMNAAGTGNEYKTVQGTANRVTVTHGVGTVTLDVAAALMRQTQTWAFSGTAALTTGKMRWYNRTGRTLTLVGAWVAANTAPTGATIIADINKNGTTVFTTQTNRPSVTVSTNGGGISAAPDVITLADGDYLTVDIDQIGSTVAGADVTVGVVYA